MKSASYRSSADDGFTLIETLVVMVISVGLVILVAALYRSVGQATLSLRGGHPEWAVQTLLRDQLANGFHIGESPWVSGTAHEITILTWKGRATGLDGKPMVAQYRFESSEGALIYREAPLPAWWNGNALPTLQQLAADVRTATPSKLVGAVESLEIGYVPADATDLDPKQWRASWQEAISPKLIVLRFKRIRDFTLWFDLRSLSAS